MRMILRAPVRRHQRASEETRKNRHTQPHFFLNPGAQAMDRTFIQERIAAVKAEIVAYETAITALTTAGITQYSIDTGQTRQTVTRLDVVRLNSQLDSLYNRLATLEARLYGSSITARPGW